MSHPKHDVNLNEQEKLPTAPLPQKNATPVATPETSKHEEQLLDTALESTFPASDPVAETTMCSPEQEAELVIEEEVIEHEQFLLDEALELTFPASDPIAIPDLQTVSKIILQQHSGQR